MKGLLTGDITSNLILHLQKIVDKYKKEIEETEEDLKNFDINVDEFYNEFFQINSKFLKTNTAKNISINLSKHFANFHYL